MRLNRENVITILEKNFGFTRIQDPELGNFIEMSPFDAYSYSAITGHGYLDNIRQPYTPNGLMQVFNQANAYNMVTGMFDRDGNLFHTPLYQVSERGYLVRGNKFILPVEYNTNAELLKKLEIIQRTIIRTNRNPQNFIICRIKRSTSGYSMEPFMEYVASKYFQRLGYFTETQIPFYYGGGTPDFAAYSLPDLRELMKSRFNFNGSSFIGLASIRAFQLHKNGDGGVDFTEAIVGEVKTASFNAIGQIKKYLSRGIFNKAYEIIPHKKSPEVIAGLLTFDDSGNIEVYEAKTPAKIIPERQTSYLEWLHNYIKYFLIANFTNEELDEFYSERTGKRTRNISELISFVNSLEIEDILDKLSNYMYGK